MRSCSKIAGRGLPAFQLPRNQLIGDRRTIAEERPPHHCVDRATGALVPESRIERHAKDGGIAVQQLTVDDAAPPDPWVEDSGQGDSAPAKVRQADGGTGTRTTRSTPSGPPLRIFEEKQQPGRSGFGWRSSRVCGKQTTPQCGVIAHEDAMASWDRMREEWARKLGGAG